MINQLITTDCDEAFAMAASQLNIEIAELDHVMAHVQLSDKYSDEEAQYIFEGLASRRADAVQERFSFRGNMLHNKFN